MLQPREAMSRRDPTELGLGAGSGERELQMHRGRRLDQPVPRILRCMALSLLRLIAVAVWPWRRAGLHGRRSQGLVGLSDHLLADIGVRRADLHAMVYARAPLSRVKPPSESNVATFGRHRTGPCTGRPTLVVDNDALDPAA